jgi:hypothetical protein
MSVLYCVNLEQLYLKDIYYIQGVPKKEDESITPLFIGRF